MLWLSFVNTDLLQVVLLFFVILKFISRHCGPWENKSFVLVWDFNIDHLQYSLHKQDLINSLRFHNIARLYVYSTYENYY